MSTCVKICRECGEEYRKEALRCADCGGELEERFLDEAGEVLEAGGVRGEGDAEETVASPPADHRVVFVTPRAADLVPLAEALRESHVPYRLAEQPAHREGAPPQYALLVPEGEAAAALQALAPLLASEGAADLAHVETRFEPERGYVQCPACGAAQPSGATECAECGLGARRPRSRAPPSARAAARRCRTPRRPAPPAAGRPSSAEPWTGPPSPHGRRRSPSSAASTSPAIARADAPRELAFFAEWIARGYAGEMAYLTSQVAKRSDLRVAFPWARSRPVRRPAVRHAASLLDRRRRARRAGSRATPGATTTTT